MVASASRRNAWSSRILPTSADTACKSMTSLQTAASFSQSQEPARSSAPASSKVRWNTNGLSVSQNLGGGRMVKILERCEPRVDQHTDPVGRIRFENLSEQE